MSAIASTSTSTFDLEAQRTFPAHTEPRALPVSFGALNPTNGAFGYTFGPASAESRHDHRLSLSDDLFASRSADANHEAPPAYTEDAGIPLPAYVREAPEPATLAMYLFKFGFLFPPFWLFGAIILLSPLREPVTSTSTDDDTPAEMWMPEKTPAERAALLAALRAVEVRWAKRCVVALAALLLLLAVGSVAAWAVMRH